MHRFNLLSKLIDLDHEEALIEDAIRFNHAERLDAFDQRLALRIFDEVLASDVLAALNAICPKD